MVQFIADHRAVVGVEPICAGLPIAPSTDSSPSALADTSDAPVRTGAARRSAPRRDSAGYERKHQRPTAPVLPQRY